MATQPPAIINLPDPRILLLGALNAILGSFSWTAEKFKVSNTEFTIILIFAVFFFIMVSRILRDYTMFSEWLAWFIGGAIAIIGLVTGIFKAMLTPVFIITRLLSAFPSGLAVLITILILLIILFIIFFIYSKFSSEVRKRKQKLEKFRAELTQKSFAKIGKDLGIK